MFSSPTAVVNPVTDSSLPLSTLAFDVCAPRPLSHGSDGGGLHDEVLPELVGALVGHVRGLGADRKEGGKLDKVTPTTSSPNDESTPQSAAASFAATTDPRKAAGQVREILKARNAERDNIFSGVMALAVYLVSAGAVVILTALALQFLGVFAVAAQYYLLAVGYCISESGIVLGSTLPPETFDLDIALDDRRGARRALTIVVLLMTGLQGLSFPHVSGLGALGSLFKLILDESVAGCCRCGARFRPRLTDTLSLCFYGTYGLQIGVKYAFSYGMCHAAAQVPGMAANRDCVLSSCRPPSTSNDANGTTTADASFPHNRTTLGNVTSSSSAKTCGGYSYNSPDANQAVFWYMQGAVRSMGSITVLITFITMRWRFVKGRGGWNPTLSFFNCCYIFFILEGISYLFLGSWRIAVLPRPAEAPSLLVLGVLTIAPILSILLYGRQKLFQVMARRFEDKRRKFDSAVIAELIDNTDIRVGQEQWIHHGNDLADEYPGVFDHRRNWWRGIIVKVKDGRYAVDVAVEQLPLNIGKQKHSGDAGHVRRRSTRIGKQQNSGRKVVPELIHLPGSLADTDLESKSIMPLPERQHGLLTNMNLETCKANVLSIALPSSAKLNAEELLKTAMDNLRLLDGQYVTQRLVAEGKTFGVDSLAALTAIRKLRANEKYIDYFISHSWHDDGQAKFAILDQVKQQFKAKYNREATFWFDKVCIDQENIRDGLKVLCINATACKKLLVVCGKTYFQRLWCVLELFIMFAFSQDDDAAERIELVPIETDGVTRESILESMSNFELEGTHCYDPNEEIKLRSVIAAVGEEQFVARMRSLAERIRAADAV